MCGMGGLVSPVEVCQGEFSVVRMCLSELKGCVTPDGYPHPSLSLFFFYLLLFLSLHPARSECS